MAVPTLAISRSAPATAAAEILVLGVHKTDDGPRLASDDAAFAALHPSLAQIGMSGSPDEVRRLPGVGDVFPIALVGLGRARRTPMPCASRPGPLRGS